MWLLQHGGSDRQGVTPGYWPRPWGHRRAYDLRQYTASATCGGDTRVDCSVFPGTRAQLESLWLPRGARPKPAPHPAPRPKPRYDVVRDLQRDAHVDPDGKWGNQTDAALQAVRRDRHDRAEQHAVGTPVDGVWGSRSQAAYLSTVGRVQTHLKKAGYYKGRVDKSWGPLTDRAFLAARADHYGKW